MFLFNCAGEVFIKNCDTIYTEGPNPESVGKVYCDENNGIREIYRKKPNSWEKVEGQEDQYTKWGFYIGEIHTINNEERIIVDRTKKQILDGCLCVREAKKRDITGDLNPMVPDQGTRIPKQAPIQCPDGFDDFDFEEAKKYTNVKLITRS
ncbi:MAG TPA: hypothetical protein DEB31_05190 [Clostridiales bacterium]|nr:hypothetical protein [Clostridiales bacterium]